MYLLSQFNVSLLKLSISLKKQLMNGSVCINTILTFYDPLSEQYKLLCDHIEQMAAE